MLENCRAHLEEVKDLTQETLEKRRGELTEALLDGLRARGVRATFFVCAYRVAQFPQTLCRAAQEGHEIGLHSCCHDYMQNMCRDEAYEDLVSCAQAVTECCGIAPRLFRPPGGLYSSDLLAAARDAGVSVILWSVDPEAPRRARSF